jgi:hypothetical protein
MKSDWLAASSLERTYEIVSAINTLLIHAKLVLAGIQEPDSESEVQQARQRLIQFLTRFYEILNSTEQSQDRTVVGADPRLSELTLRYLSEKQRQTQQTGLYSTSLTELKSLIETEQPERLPQLLSCLRELRLLLEQHSQDDMTAILGDL